MPWGIPRICQESAAKDRPHRRVAHPLAGCLSIDITGPLCRSQDQQGEKRYMLIGAFTWVKQKKEGSDETTEDVAGEGLPDEEGGDDVRLEEDRDGQERIPDNPKPSN